MKHEERLPHLESLSTKMGLSADFATKITREKLATYLRPQCGQARKNKGVEIVKNLPLSPAKFNTQSHLLIMPTALPAILPAATKMIAESADEQVS